MRPSRFKSLLYGFGVAPEEILLGLAAFVLACLCVFFIAYDFPPGAPVATTSFIAGYSNRAASLSVSLIAVSCFSIALYLFRKKPLAQPRAELIAAIPPRLLLFAGTITVVFLGLVSICAASSPRYFGEMYYSFPLLSRAVRHGDIPYRQFNYPYGPLVLYFPALIWKALTPLDVSLETASYLANILMMLSGLAMLRWILNDSALAIGSRRAVFVLAALAMLNVTLGLHYTPIRFLAAPALLLLLYRVQTESFPTKPILRACAIAFTVMGGSILAAGISPETGVALSLSVAIFLFVSALRENHSWFALIPLSFTGPAFWVAIYSPAYFDSILNFSSGFGNILIVPAPYILFFIITLTCIVPVGLARLVRDEARHLALFVSLGLVGLILVSAALGRCDPGHVMYNGIVLFLLAFALIDRYWKKLERPYIVAFGVLFTMGIHLGVEYSYRSQLKRAAYHASKRYLPRAAFIPLRAALNAHSATDKFAEADYEDAPDLSALESASRVATPFITDKRIDAYLAGHDKDVRDYFTGMNLVGDRHSVDVKLKTLAEVEYVLADFAGDGGDDDSESLKHLIMFPIRFRPRNRVQPVSFEIRDYVETNFEKVTAIGRFWLYHKRGRGVRFIPGAG